MQRYWLKIVFFVVFIVVAAIFMDNSLVWASPDQSPARQTVPTRVKSPTPDLAITESPTATVAINNPPTVIPSETPTQVLIFLPTSTVTQLDFSITELTSTTILDFSSPTRSTSSTIKIESTVTSVLVVTIINPQSVPPTDGSGSSVIAIFLIIVVILGMLVFLFRQRGIRKQ